MVLPRKMMKVTRKGKRPVEKGVAELARSELRDREAVGSNGLRLVLFLFMSLKSPYPDSES